jgi:hypothetical protein
LVEKKDDELTYKETSFFRMLKRITIKRIIISEDFLFAFLLGIIFPVLCYLADIVPKAIEDLTIIFITLSGTMIAVSIAGLAIIVALADPEFVLLLKKSKPNGQKTGSVYDNILFFYRYSTIISSLSIIFNLISRSYVLISTNKGILTVLLGISIFLVMYSVFSVVLLVGTTMRFGLLRGHYLEKKEQ